jgi:RNA polymerase sigma-70 factor (ECF subfamily)
VTTLYVQFETSRRDGILLDESEQRAVIRGLRDGQRAAWTDLYDGYSADLWRYVSRLVGSASTDVADIVQETFMVAANSAGKFDEARGSIWGWLTGIAHHHVSAYWRQIAKQERLRELADRRAGQLSRWIEGTADLREPHEVNELTEVVRATLALLSSDQAAILTAKYVDDLSLENISIDWGITVEAAKSRLARARSEFRSKLERRAKEYANEEFVRWI